MHKYLFVTCFIDIIVRMTCSKKKWNWFNIANILINLIKSNSICLVSFQKTKWIIPSPGTLKT